MKLKNLFPVLVLSLVLTISGFAQRGGHGGSHYRGSHSHGSSASRPYYGGGHHTTAHGGHYPGSVNSHHKGGHYANPRTNNHYGKHKP